MNAPEPNGQHKVLWWIIGAVLGPIVLAVFGNVLNTTINTSERTSALQAQYHDMSQRLHRIETKLDQLLSK